MVWLAILADVGDAEWLALLSNMKLNCGTRASSPPAHGTVKLRQ
ncbi:hypothetical protein SAMN05216573_1422 [Bradyrhizobium sp. Rc3b]|nr:hypothetical protein SAMN05216573_1422 [Bradyrhizobium sp. Rc3b]